MKKLIKSASMIKASWPEELTFDDYEEGDQIIDGYVEAVDDLDIFVESDARGGVGEVYFYKDDSYDELLYHLPSEEEDEIISEFYWSSKSKEDYVEEIKNWLRRVCDI